MKDDSARFNGLVSSPLQDLNMFAKQPMWNGFDIVEYAESSTVPCVSSGASIEPLTVPLLFALSVALTYGQLEVKIMTSLT